MSFNDCRIGARGGEMVYREVCHCCMSLLLGPLMIAKRKEVGKEDIRWL